MAVDRGLIASVFVPADELGWLLLNDAMRARPRDVGYVTRLKQQARKAAYAEWDAASVRQSSPGRVRVVVESHYVSGTMCDPDAVSPMVKPVIDAAVDAGVIGGDDFTHIEEVTYLAPTKGWCEKGLRVSIIAADGVRRQRRD